MPATNGSVNERATSEIASLSVEDLAGRSVLSPDVVEQMSSRPTAQIDTTELLDLIDQTAPEEGVVDMHAIERPKKPRAKTHNQHVTHRIPTNPGERATSKMEPLVRDARDENEMAEASVSQLIMPMPELVPPVIAAKSNRTWLVAGIASVAFAAAAVLAML